MQNFCNNIEFILGLEKSWMTLISVSVAGYFGFISTSIQQSGVQVREPQRQTVLEVTSFEQA
jgi:hypothetical protein